MTKMMTTAGLPLSTRCVVLSGETKTEATIEVIGVKGFRLIVRQEYEGWPTTIGLEFKTLACCSSETRVLIEVAGVWTPALAA